MSMMVPYFYSTETKLIEADFGKSFCQERSAHFKSISFQFRHPSLLVIQRNYSLVYYIYFLKTKMKAITNSRYRNAVFS